jgi:hypothetical protein
MTKMMTPDRVSDALRLFAQLPQSAPFGYLRVLAAGDLAIDTAEITDDTLNIGAYSIQETLEDVPTIAGERVRSVFLVCETVASGGGYWEPEDADLAEFTRVYSFADALREIVLREVFHHVGNIQEADGLSAAFSEEA